MKQRNRIFNRTVITSLVLLALAAALLIAARSVDGFAHWYSINVYSLITASLGRLSGAAVFSIAEIAVIVLPILIILDIIRCRKNLTASLSHLLLIISVLFFLYAANCGVNYYREPFVDQEKLSNAGFTEEQLADYCEYIVTQLERYDPDKKSEAETEYPDYETLAGMAQNALYNLSDSFDSLRGYYPLPKKLSVLSRAFSGMGVSGIYSPFTVEANINGEMPDMEKPFTACHELSHLRGFMNEGEANYIGWLACIGSDDDGFNRSGWLIAWMHAGGALRRAGPDKYEQLRSRLPEYAAAEIEEDRQFWAAHEGKASEIQDRVNDKYLKANGQQAGVQSYGMLTTLMLMWFYD